MKKILGSLLSLFMLASCNTTTCDPNTQDCTVYNPTPYYTCSYTWVNDPYSGQSSYQYVCYWVYYSQDGSSTRELDMVADIADQEQIVISKSAEIYAEKYSLSLEQGRKIAKQVYDLNALKERSAQDLADFAQKLYGVNPTDLVQAISDAQVGSNAALEKLISEASVNFQTSAENMKVIIKDLHKKALEASGINL